MKMVRMLLFAAAITMPAFALMQAYSVEPVKAAWSGKVKHDVGVAQTVTCCWDELDSSCYVLPLSDFACALGVRA
jgi:hypothetical protein